MRLEEIINKHKNSIFNIGLIVLALIVANIIYKKQTTEIESLRSKINMEIKMIGELGNTSQLKKKINAYENLLTEKDKNSIINTINNIAKESDVKIVSLRPALEKKYADYIKFPFDLTISILNYHDLGKFISKIENYKDPYLVEALSIIFEKTTKKFNVNLRLSAIEIIK